MFAPLPDKPDHDALERRRACALGARADVRAAARAERGRPAVQLRRRARDGKSDGARGAHRLGQDAEGRLPALQGAPGAPPALPERVRLPGALDRGRRRALAGPQLEARDRGVRPRRVRPPVPGGRRAVVQGADRGLDPARAVDGLGLGLLHLQRHQHRVHLAVPEGRARAWLALPRTPLDRMVSALRHVALPARADAGRRLPGAQRPVALRALPAPRASGRVGRHLDDDAVDAAGERRRGRQAGRRVRAARERRVGRRRPVSGRALRPPCPGRRAGRVALPRPVRRARARWRGGAPGDPVGRGLAGGGHRDRPHRAGRRAGGLRARACPRAAGALSGRRGGPLLRRLRLAPRALDDRGRRPDRRPAGRAGIPARGGLVRPPLPALLALRHAAHLAGHRRLADLRSTSCASRSSTRTQRWSGRPRTWASAWTTGSGTWATGTSRAAATTASRCRSTRAPAAT